MIWQPETDEERAQARRFYEEAHAFNPEVPWDEPPPEPGQQRRISGMERVLIDRILDNPDDDGPRLA